jgi:hypothetical protein
MVTFLRVFFLSAIAAGALLADSIQFTVFPTIGPHFTSSYYTTFTDNAVYALEHGLTSYGDPNSPSYYSQQDHGNYAETFYTYFDSWRGNVSPTGNFASEVGNLIIFSEIIRGEGLFKASSISYKVTGSGSAVDDYAWDGDYTVKFGSSVVGVVDNADGSVRYVTSGLLSDTFVNAIIMRGRGIAGFMDTCWGCTSTADYVASQAYGVAQLAGLASLTMTTTVHLVDGSTASGSGTFKFDDAATPEPSTALFLAAPLLALALARRRRG